MTEPTERQKIEAKALEDEITITPGKDGEMSFFLPNDYSLEFKNFLREHQLNPCPPKEAIASTAGAVDEIKVDCSAEQADQLKKEFAQFKVLGIPPDGAKRNE